MEPEPSAVLVERNQEEVVALQVAKDPCRARLLQEGVAQGRGEPLHDRHRTHELPGLHVPTQHLFDEVVPDEPAAAAELPHELVGIRPARQGQAGKVDPGRPPFGAFHQQGGSLGRQPDALDLRQCGDLRPREAEVLGTDLSELAGRPDPAEAQPGVRPSDDHQVRLRGEVLDEQLHLAVAARLADDVEVVQQDDGLLGRRRQGVDHAAQGLVPHVAEARCEVLARAEPAGPLQGNRHVCPQSGRVVVTGVERDPRRRSSRHTMARQPLRHERRLAVAGRGSDESDGPLDRPLQLVDQTGSGYPFLANGRLVELRLQERVDRPRHACPSIASRRPRRSQQRSPIIVPTSPSGRECHNRLWCPQHFREAD